jgi:hypothetical protein
VVAREGSDMKETVWMIGLKTWIALVLGNIIGAMIMTAVLEEAPNLVTVISSETFAIIALVFILYRKRPIY